MERNVKLGIDLGGPVIWRPDENADKEWEAPYETMRFLELKPVEHAFEIIHELVGELGVENVFFVTKSRASHQMKTLHWLDHHKVFKKTGVSQYHLAMCIERHEKSAIAESLGLTDFVDDRLEILGKLPTVPRKYLFRGRKKDEQRYRPALQQVYQSDNWQHLRGLILAR